MDLTPKAPFIWQNGDVEYFYNIITPDNFQMGPALCPDAVQIEINGDIILAKDLTVTGTLESIGVATLADGSLLKTNAAPTTDAMIANKKYVDDTAGGGGTVFETTAALGAAETVGKAMFLTTDQKVYVTRIG